MPNVEIWGLDVNDTTLDEIRMRVRIVVSNISQLGLKPSQVWVRFPAEHRPVEGKLLIRIADLFNKPQRTAAVRLRLARELKHLLDEYRTPPHRAECEIMPFRISNGFAATDDPPLRTKRRTH